jgi:hypothetical protein
MRIDITFVQGVAMNHSVLGAQRLHQQSDRTVGAVFKGPRLLLVGVAATLAFMALALAALIAVGS